MNKNIFGPVAFFTGWFQATNETFVSNEFYALQQRGVFGDIYYQRIQKDNIQPVNKKILFLRRSIYSYPFSRLRSHIGEILRTNITLFINRPGGYIRAVAILFRVFSRENLSLFIRASLMAVRLVSTKTKLIYVHDGEKVTLLAILCASFTRIPCGVIFHTEYLFAKPDQLALKLSYADFCVFQSEYSKRYAQEKAAASFFMQKRFYVVSSPGVDVHLFSSMKEASLFKKKDVKIISVGRLEQMKGFDRLIKAVHLLVQEGTSVRCVIVGYGSQKRKLEDLIRSLHLEKNVQLTGPLGHSKKLVKLMSEADMFVLPSLINNVGDRDMQPNAVKEAMAMQLLVLTSNFGGTEEVIKDGKNGFLLPSSEPEMIASLIRRVWKFSERKKQVIKKNARESIMMDHQQEAIADRLISLFARECQQ